MDYGRSRSTLGGRSENHNHSSQRVTLVRTALTKHAQLVARRLANSTWFSTITTVLTIYALFGDDIRLVGTEKPSDYIFDCITVASMLIFSLEIIFCTVGKVGYLFGFFFWLDMLSTVTLLLDITSIAEGLFGDSISNTSAQNSGGGRGGASEDSAEAGRAARVSRAGTKAGRVVRLIRLVRLMRLLRTYKKGAYQDEDESIAPGYEAGEDTTNGQEKESAVSKKLSEMTTRRVIMLVLVIILALPFFQPTWWRDTMPSSAQYGINVLYRRFTDDMAKFTPWANASARASYLQSTARRVYVDDFYQMVYYHNPLCNQIPSGSSSPEDVLSKLFWVGATGSDTGSQDFFLPRSDSTTVSQLNERWRGLDWFFYQCELSADVVKSLNTQWDKTKSCLSNTARGVALTRPDDSELQCPEELRYQERSVVYPSQQTDAEWDNMSFLFVFDRRGGSRLEALLNTFQTLFICFLLGFGAMTFSRDANTLVLTPIERMITKLNRIRNNPLEAMAIGDEEHHREQVANRKSRHAMKTDDSDALSTKGSASDGRFSNFVDRWFPWIKRFSKRTSQQVPEPMETVILEKTIIKIGSLLALGFGEAGAEIIGQNMKGGDSSALNAMIPGRRVEAIFGFCDIRNFNVITEVLKERTMVFVNQVADIVHRIVDQHLGAANKNLGHSFLLVWQFNRIDHPQREKLADLSVVAFIQVVSALSRDLRLSEISAHPLLTSRMPGFRVSVGFGLHLGWAIAGAIGSEYKIDASYVSPHVNLAAQLEDAAWSYGVTILMSEPLVRLCNPEFRRCFRPIDHVQLAGSSKAMHIFTVDLDTSFLRYVDRTSRRKLASRTEVLAAREKRRKALLNDSYRVHEVLVTDKYIWAMRQHLSLAFFQQFECGFLNYVAGEWGVAAQVLAKTRVMLLARGGSDDGPSRCLVEYMGSYGNEAPADWPGWHELRPN
mmetsp:Transcript_71030/g.205660  ORF Transcript_71030/g.205660 Transcript_71030/m.205660 type:complete len:947 (+) Transcript_71030:134-2974(+)